MHKFMRSIASMMSKDKKRSSKIYAKEADVVKLKNVPIPGMFYVWQQELREEIVCASGRGDTAFKWIMEVESKDTTFDSLADSGKFVSLDIKLGRAVRDAAASNDNLSKILQDKRNLVSVKEETIMKGRQALFMIYQYYATTGIKKGLTSITVLMAVRLYRKRLQEFLSTWDRVLLHIDETPSTAVLTRLFYDQVKSCDLMKIDISTYHRMSDDDPNKSYAWLRKCVEGEIDRHRKTIMDDSLHDRMMGVNVGIGRRNAAPAAPTKSSGKTSKGRQDDHHQRHDHHHHRAKQRSQTRGRRHDRHRDSSSSSDTPHQGPSDEEDSSSPQQSRTDDTSGSESDGSSSESQDNTCRYFKKTGHCRYGDRCKYAHSEQDSAPKQRHKSKGVCIFFLKGTCKKGKDCNYQHPRDIDTTLSAKRSSGNPRRTKVQSSSDSDSSHDSSSDKDEKPKAKKKSNPRTKNAHAAVVAMLHEMEAEQAAAAKSHQRRRS